MNVITAPHDIYDLGVARAPSIFLAGGITNCPDWQSELIELLRERATCAGVTVYNPRRTDFDITNPKASEEQICWEFAKLRDADIVSFWFASGSVNPIVFYELGMWGLSRCGRPIVVGCDPAFTRMKDVVIQSQLARPEIDVVFTLETMANRLAYAVGNVDKERR